MAWQRTQFFPLFRIISAFTAFFFFLFLISPQISFAFDVTVSEGDASISRDGDTTTVTVGSRAVLEGNTSILESEAVRVIQGSNDVLMRDITGLQTQWLGTLLADGAIILVNPSGVYIAQAAQIDVRSLIVSTLDINNASFMAGNLAFQRMEGVDPAKILNEANISVKDGGYLVFLSSGAIENKGTLTAYLGTVALGAGEKAFLHFDEKGLINLAVEEGIAEQIRDSQGNPVDAVKNSGVISAAGGRVQITAKMLGDVLDRLVNNEGVIRAVRAEERDGVIELAANGSITNSGTIDADTGNINIDAGKTGAVLNEGALRYGILNEKGYSFKTRGSLLGGPDGGRAFYENVDGSANISGNIGTDQSDVGNLIVDGATTLTADNLTFTADSNNNGNGIFTMEGELASLDGGGYDLTIYSGQDRADENDESLGAENSVFLGTTNIGTLTLHSSTEDDGIDTTYESDGGYDFNIDKMKTVFHAIFTRDYNDGDFQYIYSVSNAIGGLQYIGTDAGTLSGDYMLANDIDASETSHWGVEEGFAPLGVAPWDGDAFTGMFDGQNHAISNLYINRSGEDSVGLFGGTDGARISNVGVVDANITGEDNVGALIGVTAWHDVYYTNVDNCYVTGTVSGFSNVGGLVGNNTGDSTISRCYSDVSVMGANYTGGLVGFNGNYTYGPGRIDNCYAIGAVTGSGDFIGGLVGVNHYDSTIDESYATGTVTGREYVGGLAGLNDDGSEINSCYAVGAVNGESYIGGLVGWDEDAGGISECGWYGESGVGSPMGGDAVCAIGNTAASVTYEFTNLQNVFFNPDSDFYLGKWDISSELGADWAMSGNNNAYPMLQFRYPQEEGDIGYIIKDAYQLQLMFLDLGAEYELAGNIDADETAIWNPYGEEGTAYNYGFAPVGVAPWDGDAFSGTFDGQNHTIASLYINRPDENYVGLFGGTDGATISNLGLETVDITGANYVGGLVGANNYYSVIDNSYAEGTVTGANYVGGLVGANYYHSSIDNSYATATAEGTDCVGGLVGWNKSESTVSHSYATGEVTGADDHVGGLVGYNGSLYGDSAHIDNCYATGAVEGRYCVGGLVGKNYYYSDIDNCYSTGEVTGVGCVGGLVGINFTHSYINNSYATGLVTGEDDTGGLVGFDCATGAITDSFWDTETTGQAASAGGEPKTTAEMKDWTTFSDAEWDAGDVWVTRDGQEYPTLYWQHTYWTGNGADENWSTAENWSTGIVPDETTLVVFNGQSGSDATQDIARADGLWIGSDYGGTITETTDLTVDHDYYQAGGTFNAGANTLSVGGNWTHTSILTFNAETSTVVLNGTDQAVRGETTFNDLEKTAGGGQTLIFESGKTQTVNGTLTLEGTDATDQLKIRSSVEDEQWTLYLGDDATSAVKYLDVQDSAAENGTVDCSTGCTDSGNNNENWVFATPAPPAPSPAAPSGDLVSPETQQEIETEMPPEATGNTNYNEQSQSQETINEILSSSGPAAGEDLQGNMRSEGATGPIYGNGAGIWFPRAGSAIMRNGGIELILGQLTAPAHPQGHRRD